MKVQGGPPKVCVDDLRATEKRALFFCIVNLCCKVRVVLCSSLARKAFWMKVKVHILEFSVSVQVKSKIELIQWFYWDLYV